MEKLKHARETKKNIFSATASDQNSTRNSSCNGGITLYMHESCVSAVAFVLPQKWLISLQCTHTHTIHSRVSAFSPPEPFFGKFYFLKAFQYLYPTSFAVVSNFGPVALFPCIFSDTSSLLSPGGLVLPTVLIKQQKCDRTLSGVIVFAFECKWERQPLFLAQKFWHRNSNEKVEEGKKMRDKKAQRNQLTTTRQDNFSFTFLTRPPYFMFATWKLDIQNM